MTDEQPVAFKKRKTVSGSILTCIVHFENHRQKEDVKPVTSLTFETIKKSAAIRQSAEGESKRLDSICANIPAELDNTKHGIHRWCYQIFTNVSKIVKSLEEAKPNSLSLPCAGSSHGQIGLRKSSRSVPSSSNKSTLFPQDECIFCLKKRKRTKNCEEGLSKCVSKTAEASIKQCAAVKPDKRLHIKITGEDLIAKEARYHESCRKAYVRYEDRQHHPISTNQESEDVKHGGKEQRTAYQEAFQHLCQYVTTNIIERGCVERMNMLRERYLSYILEKTPQFYNENHKTEKLKAKLSAFFGNKIDFWRPQNYNRSDLVYPTDISTGEAVAVGFEAATSESKIVEEAALILRRHIQSSFKSSNEMPWPPSADYLKSDGPSPPSSVTDFMSVLISGKKFASTSAKVQRLANSFSQDVCSATTQNKWKMPKQISLATTLRSLGVGAKVQTIINRYGHCMSYSQSLELETALAKQVSSADTVLPTNISTTQNVVSHLCWDNFDINEETPSGAGTTHTTHGIVVQEVNGSSSHLVNRSSSTVTKSKKRSFKFVSSSLPTCYSKKRAEPPVTSQNTLTAQRTEKNDLSVQSSVKTLWILSRMYANQCSSIPQWSGWISKISDDGTTTVQSNIGYMAPILHPITEYATVQKCLETSMEVSKSLKQKYTFVTMDLAAAKIAYDIIWDLSNSEKFSTVVLNLGPFHIMCSYMGSIGKMMTGSGFEHILLQSSICASGSIDQVMSGKHYNRAVRVHQRVFEALERMMFEKFVSTMKDTATLDMFSQRMTTKSDYPNSESFAELLNDDNLSQLVEQYDNFKNSIRAGDLGKTAQFWISYCDCVWTLLLFQFAVKTNDLAAYTSTLKDMCGLMFSSNHLHYARYLPIYYVTLLNLEKSHPGASALLQNNGLTASRSNVPGCRNAIDLTIEQTINRSAKTSGGIIGFSRNKAAYYRWCITRHRRAEYADLTLEQLDMQDSCDDGHKSARTSQVKQSECEVSSVVSAFKQFVNPFSMDDDSKKHLYCLSSGLPSNDKVEEDLLRYVKTGNEAADEFIQSRLANNAMKFQDPVRKSKLCTFGDMAAKKTLTSKEKKAIEIKAERNLIGNLLLLSQKHDISLEKLFCYSLGPIPWSLATTDGALVKTDKSQLMHLLQENVTTTSIAETETYCYILDGNAMFQSSVMNPETFGEFAEKMFHCLPKSPIIHFVTDTYRDSSIKEQERKRRCGVMSTIELECIKPETKLPKDFKRFLFSGRSKTQLIQFILNQWQTPQYANLYYNRKIMFASEGSCVALTSVDGLNVTKVEEPLYATTQEEADTRLVLHAVLASQEVDENVKLIIRSPDTDVFILLISHCHRIKRETLFETGTGNNRRILNINQIERTIGTDLAEALPAFHAFTGCDTTSSFVRKGKRVPFKVLSANKNFVSLFKDFGAQINWMTGQKWIELQQFVCTTYGRPNYVDTNVLRYDLFKARYEPKSSRSTLHFKNGIDLSLLPPCQSSLELHTKRATYQAFIWRNAHNADVTVPSPEGNGWKRNEDNVLEVEWTEGDVMPRMLADILICDKVTNSSATNESEAVPDDLIEEDELDNILDVIFDDEETEDDF